MRESEKEDKSREKLKWNKRHREEGKRESIYLVVK